MRHHFRFEAKRKRNFFRFDAKKVLFLLVSHWNEDGNKIEPKMERSENKMKKKRKTAIIFASKRNEAKRKQKTAILFVSKQNEAKQKQKTVIVFASKRNGSEIFLL